MKPKTAILLVVVLLAVVAIIVVRQGSHRPVAQSDKRLWTDNFGQIAEIILKPASGEVVHFVKKDGDWRITEPVNYKAVNYVVQQFAEIVNRLQYQQVFVPGGADIPATSLTGLDKPAWIATLKDSTGSQRVLMVGQPVPLSGKERTYVQPAGSKNTYVVGFDLNSLFSKPPKEYRDNVVLDVPKDSIVRVRLEGREKIGLTKKGGQWFITEPVSATADNNAVIRLLDKLASVQAQEFVDDNPTALAPYGLEPGSETLTVRFWAQREQPATASAPALIDLAPLGTTSAPASAPSTGPATVEEGYVLSLGLKTLTNRYAKLGDSPTVFLVQSPMLDDLQPELNKLRQNRLLSFSVGEAASVEFERSTGKAELVKEGRTWHMTQPFQGKANAKTVGDLLVCLSRLDAQDFRDGVGNLASFGLDPARAKVTINLTGNGGKQVLLVGGTSPSGDLTFMKTAVSDSVAVVPTSQVELVIAAPAVYWDLPMWSMPAGGEATGMTLKRPDGAFAMRRGEGTWQITAPKAATADAENIRKMIDQFENLKATQIVALGDKVPPKYTKAKDLIELTLTGKAASTAEPATETSQPTETVSSWSLAMAVAKIDRKSYAWIEGSKGQPVAVGEFPATLYDTLLSEVHDRTIWQLDPNTIQQVNILAGPDSVRLHRDGQEWKCDSDPFLRINNEKVSLFLQSIQSIKAEKIVSRTPPKKAELKEFGLDDPWFTFKLLPFEGKELEIIVSRTGGEKFDTSKRYAQASSMPGVLQISAETAGKLARKITDFRQ